MEPKKKPAAFIGGGVGVAIALLVALSAGSPWVTLHRTDATAVLPPMWFLSVLWFGWFFILGSLCGGLLLSRRRGAYAEALFWRGMTCLVLSVVCSFVWYVLFFGKGSLFFSWLCLPLALAAALLTALSWWQTVGKGEACVPLGFALWILCLFLLQMAVLLHA